MDRADKVDIFGVEIQDTTLQQLIGELKVALENKKFCKVFTPNTEIVMMAKKSDGLKNELNKGTYVIPDGIGLIYGARLRGVRLRERVTGYDTSMELLRLAQKEGYGLYLLGGREGVAQLRDPADGSAGPGALPEWCSPHPHRVEADRTG